MPAPTPFPCAHCPCGCAASPPSASAGPVFCSPITARILRHDMPSLRADCLRILQVGETVNICGVGVGVWVQAGGTAGCSGVGWVQAASRCCGLEWHGGPWLGCVPLRADCVHVGKVNEAATICRVTWVGAPAHSHAFRDAP